jgi:hypothetical protein
MYGVLPKTLLVDISFMSVLLIHIVALLGFTFSNVKMMCSEFFFIFNNMLNDFWVERSYMCNLIGGGQYHRLNKFFSDIGISHQVSCPHTHQQNCTAETKQRHIVEHRVNLTFIYLYFF